MRALVVYESMFGNTKEIAEAIRDGLARSLGATTCDVRNAPTVLDDDIALLVVGGPTHAFGLPRSTTRKDAAKHGNGPGVGSEHGLREWLPAIDASAPDTRAAAFSTIVAKPGWIRRVGSAGKVIDRRLRGAGFDVLVRPAGFLVEGMTGPLTAGERERARQWGSDLAGLMKDREARREGLEGAAAPLVRTQ